MLPKKAALDWLLESESPDVDDSHVDCAVLVPLVLGGVGAVVRFAGSWVAVRQKYTWPVW